MDSNRPKKTISHDPNDTAAAADIRKSSAFPTKVWWIGGAPSLGPTLLCP
jgi:hypothetical protein